MLGRILDFQRPAGSGIWKNKKNQNQRTINSKYFKKTLKELLGLVYQFFVGSLTSSFSQVRARGRSLKFWAPPVMRLYASSDLCHGFRPESKNRPTQVISYPQHDLVSTSKLNHSHLQGPLKPYTPTRFVSWCWFITTLRWSMTNR